MPLVNADLCLLTNPGSGALYFRFQVSGVRNELAET
jgi:hypothetical protein